MKRQRLIRNLIDLHRKEICLDVDLSAHLIDLRMGAIKCLLAKLGMRTIAITKTEKTIEETFFGRNITYGDGTKHFMANSWNE